MYKTLMNSIWDSLHFFKNHFILLASITLPFIIALEIFEVYYIKTYLLAPFIPADLAPLLLAHLTIKSFYGSAIIVYLSSVISTPTVSIQQAWLLSVKYWPAYIALNFLTNLLIGAGFLFYVIPGMVIFILMSFAEFFLILDNQSPSKAIKSSFVSTRKFFPVLTAGFIILMVLTFYPYTMINTLFDIGSPELNIDLFQQFLQVDSTIDSESLHPDQLLIAFPESSFLKSSFSIIFDVIKIIFTIFAFRIFQLSKDKI